MNILIDALDEARARGSKKKVKAVTGGRFFCYHPTKDDKPAIDELFSDLESSLSVISEKMVEGFTFTLTYAEATHSFSALIRERGVDWDKARCTSVWHSSPERAMAGLAYYLTNVNPGWPDGHPTSYQTEFDW